MFHNYYHIVLVMVLSRLAHCDVTTLSASLPLSGAISKSHPDHAGTQELNICAPNDDDLTNICLACISEDRDPRNGACCAEPSVFESCASLVDKANAGVLSLDKRKKFLMGKRDESAFGKKITNMPMLENQNGGARGSSVAAVEDQMFSDDDGHDNEIQEESDPVEEDNEDENEEEQQLSSVSDKRRSAFLGKRRSAFLGKHRSAFLGKRRSAFLGKRRSAFLGKRRSAFLGKRRSAFLGKRRSAFLGKKSVDSSDIDS